MQSFIKYKWFLNRSTWPIDGSLTGTTTPSQSEAGSSDNEGFSTLSSIPELVTPLDAFWCISRTPLFWRGLIPLQGKQCKPCQQSGFPFVICIRLNKKQSIMGKLWQQTISFTKIRVNLFEFIMSRLDIWKIEGKKVTK